MIAGEVQHRTCAWNNVNPFDYERTWHVSEHTTLKLQVRVIRPFKNMYGQVQEQKKKIAFQSPTFIITSVVHNTREC